MDDGVTPPRKITPSITPLSRMRLSYAEEVVVWRQYVTFTHTVPGRDALDELILRHDKMLMRLAWGFVRQHPQIGNFEDFHQHARVGAMTAYDRFKEDKSAIKGSKLSTFVWRTVENYLKTMVDEDSFVRCPTQMRAMRSYLSGKYDKNPEKKRAFEQKYGLDTPEKIRAVKEKFRLLHEKVTSLDVPHSVGRDYRENTYPADHLVSPDALTEDELIGHLELKLAREHLTERQQKVYDLCLFEEETMKVTAERLEITEGQVRGDLRSIREKMKAWEQQTQRERKQHGIL
jgi:RNA polymerase sigma factor (sigma-70 family)